MVATYSHFNVADFLEQNQLAELAELAELAQQNQKDIQMLKDEINVLKNKNQQEPVPENRTLHSPSQTNAQGINNGSCYRTPCFFLYISYACRLLFAFTFWDLSGPLKKWIASTFLFLSVVIPFSRREEDIRQEDINETETLDFIRIVGWLFNLGGAIVFFAANPYCYICIDNSRAISLGLLAFGHSVELVHLLCLPKSPGKKAYIISLCCCIVGFLLIQFAYNHTFFYIAGCTLLTIHAIAQYVGIIYERPQTPVVSTHNNTPEPLPDDMLDSFTFMMVSDNIKVWHFGFLIFFIQLSLAIIILVDQAVNNITGVPLDVPYEVPWFVTVAQGIGLFLCTFWQSDILTSIHMLDMFWWRKNEKEWPYEEIHAKDSTSWTWREKVLFPNTLRFIGGLLVLATSFVIIVKSDNIIDLFKDFTALILISQIDNMAFSLAAHCYFGKTLKDESDKVKRIRVNDNSDSNIRGVPIRLIFVLVITLVAFVGWAYFVIGQTSGRFRRQIAM